MELGKIKRNGFYSRLDAGSNRRVECLIGVRGIDAGSDFGKHAQAHRFRSIPYLRRPPAFRQSGRHIVHKRIESKTGNVRIEPQIVFGVEIGGGIAALGHAVTEVVLEGVGTRGGNVGIAIQIPGGIEFSRFCDQACLAPQSQRLEGGARATRKLSFSAPEHSPKTTRGIVRKPDLPSLPDLIFA